MGRDKEGGRNGEEECGNPHVSERERMRGRQNSQRATKITAALGTTRHVQQVTRQY